MTDKICALDECQHTFIDLSPAKNKKYCSSKHQILSQSRRSNSKRTYSKTCENETCQKEFICKDYRQRFCSHSCSAKISNVSRKKPRNKCVVCGTEVKAVSSQYCSTKCYRGYEKEERINQWVSGNEEVADKATQSLSRWAREYLIEQADEQCTRCGWNTPNPVLGRPILTVNHIDGNWKNNKFDNLEVICYNCHTLTPTFGALNIGSGSGTRAGSDKRKR